MVSDMVRINKVAVHVKHRNLKKNIQSPVAQQVCGIIETHEQCLIITTSDFSLGSVKEAAQADKTPVELINGEQLVMLWMEHDIGVRHSMPDGHLEKLPLPHLKHPADPCKPSP